MGAENHARVIGQLSRRVPPLSDDEVAALVERDHVRSQLPVFKPAVTGDRLADETEYRRRLADYMQPTKKNG
jgi:hypothetical protein